MAKLFISFRSEDKFKVWGLRNLAEFDNVELEFDDVSLREAIDSRDESYIKSIIRPKIKDCDYCLCLIGENTHRSRKWVPWEIQWALEIPRPVIAMRFKDTPNAITPAVLKRNEITTFNWDLDRLFRIIT